MTSSRFLHGFSRSSSGELLLEVILPAGSISGVFRHLDRRSIAVEGVIDRVKWTVVPDISLETEVIEIVLPPEFDAAHLGVHLNEADGRVVFKVPRAIDFR
jgi:hypothetical protein